MRVYIVRHGQTVWNTEGRIQGSTDIELDDTGVTQAKLVSASLEPLGAQAILSSDLKRAAQTAAAIAQCCSIPIHFDPSLRERNMGDWEGRTFDEYRHYVAAICKADDNLGLDVRPSNGESLRDCYERAEPLVSKIQSWGEPIVVVTHGAMAGSLLCQLLGAGIESVRAFRFANASITVLERMLDGHYFLQKYNDVSHLDPIGLLTGSADGTHR